MTKPFLVIGKNSQLGKTLSKAIVHYKKSKRNLLISEKNFVFLSSKELDLTNINYLNYFFENNQFSGIINFAAYTLVDKAENDECLANQINHLAVAKLSEIAKNYSIPLFHISTDYVFNGESKDPYFETDTPDPQNIYGLTKLRGENAMISSGCTGAIIRTSWLYSEFCNNFVKSMLDLSKHQNKINVISDQIGCPTNAMNLANLILRIISSPKIATTFSSQLNTYHFSDEGFCSWYDFTKEIFNLAKIDCLINPISSNDYPSKAIRPKNNILSKNKIKILLPDLEIPHWKKSLSTFFEETHKA